MHFIEILLMISDDVKRIDLLFVKEFSRYTNVVINKINK